MLDFFKKEPKPNPVTISEKVEAILTETRAVLEPQKTSQEIIQEIHDTLYSEVDRLLADAKILKSAGDVDQEAINKADRLSALGFTKSSVTKDGEGEQKRVEEVQRENTKKHEIAKAIEYFSFKYPSYKFITEESIEAICKKYGLYFGGASEYIGDIPDKNISQIENFKVKDEDCVYTIVTYTFSSSFSKEVPYEEASVFMEKETLLSDTKRWHRRYMGSMSSDIMQKSSLKIVAPLKDFDTRNKRVVGHRIIPVEYPIVLHLVMFMGTVYYLIVTAWGLEAGDELIVNPNHN